MSNLTDLSDEEIRDLESKTVLRLRLLANVALFAAGLWAFSAVYWLVGLCAMLVACARIDELLWGGEHGW